MRLQLNGTPIGIDGQVDEALLVVHTGQVTMNHSMVRAQAEGTEVSCNSPVMGKDHNLLYTPL